MPQPIVPVEIPQSRCFDSKKRNDILLKIRIGKLELSFFQSLNLEMIERFENGKLTWPSTEKDVEALTPEQVDRLMKGFSITPKINSSESRDFY